MDDYLNNGCHNYDEDKFHLSKEPSETCILGKWNSSLTSARAVSSGTILFFRTSKEFQRSVRSSKAECFSDIYYNYACEGSMATVADFFKKTFFLDNLTGVVKFKLLVLLSSSSSNF